MPDRTECYEHELTLTRGILFHILRLSRIHNARAQVYRTQIEGMWHFAVDFNMYDDPMGRDDTVHRYILFQHPADNGEHEVAVVHLNHA